ncbi:MAG: hypothetical protein AB1Z23_02120 [Eubacteriales bacterium]
MKVIKVIFLDKDKNVLLETIIKELPINEESIIKKSIDYFNDPEPCIIHKTYSRNSIIFEINDFILDCIDNDVCKIKPDGIFLKYVNMPADIDRILLKKCDRK